MNKEKDLIKDQKIDIGVSNFDALLFLAGEKSTIDPSEIESSDLLSSFKLEKLDMVKNETIYDQSSLTADFNNDNKPVQKSFFADYKFNETSVGVSSCSNSTILGIKDQEEQAKSADNCSIGQ